MSRERACRVKSGSVEGGSRGKGRVGGGICWKRKCRRKGHIGWRGMSDGIWRVGGRGVS